MNNSETLQQGKILLLMLFCFVYSFIFGTFCEPKVNYCGFLVVTWLKQPVNLTHSYVLTSASHECEIHITIQLCKKKKNSMDALHKSE